MPEKTKEIVTPKEYQTPKVEFKHTAKFIFNKKTYLVRSKKPIPKGTSFAEILKVENINKYKVFPLDVDGEKLPELNVFVRGNMSTAKGIKKAKKLKKSKKKEKGKTVEMYVDYEKGGLKKIKLKRKEKLDIKGIEEYEKESKKIKPTEEKPLEIYDYEGKIIKVKPKKKKPKIKEKYE